MVWWKSGTLNLKFDPSNLSDIRAKSTTCSLTPTQPRSFHARMIDRSESGRILCKKVDIQQRQAQSSQSSLWPRLKAQSLPTGRFFDELFLRQNDQNVGHGLQIQAELRGAHQLGQVVSNFLRWKIAPQLLGWSLSQAVGHHQGHHLCHLHRAQVLSPQL
jgi:hypothetical protein